MLALNNICVNLYQRRRNTACFSYGNISRLFLFASNLFFYITILMKIVNSAYKYRFYLTEEQKKQLAHSFGCSRFVYNRFLKIRTDAYYEKHEKINYHKTSELLRAKKG